MAGPDRERAPSPSKICAGFASLMERSQELFTGLRELPQFGKEWKQHFQATFEVYTKLWKYQQMHRAVLESQESLSLKRWEIGDIASKIGQLYYHYYLRTSNSNYLEEAYVFYDAIRSRQYYKDIGEMNNQTLFLKKLRYLARFMIVCLLTFRYATVEQLIDDLNEGIEEFVSLFGEQGIAEWKIVVAEVKRFISAERTLVIEDNGVAIPLEYFNPPSTQRMSLPRKPDLKIQEVVVVAAKQNQVKFSELTLDMLRMIQLLERRLPKPVDTNPHHTPRMRGNPRKHLLYRPPFSQLFLFLATAFRELQEGGALLCYIAADAMSPDESCKAAREGFSLSVSSSINTTKTNTANDPVDCLLPYDFTSFARKPLILIVDGETSFCFQNIPRVFSAPFLVFSSPQASPMSGASKVNLFSFFLGNPLQAFCYVCNVDRLTKTEYDHCVKAVKRFEAKISDALFEYKDLDSNFRSFLDDQYAQHVIIRFLFCLATLSHHKAFKGKEAFLPKSNPALPTDIVNHSSVLNMLRELVKVTNTASMVVLEAEDLGQ